jgi:hypothetical protein
MSDTIFRNNNIASLLDSELHRVLEELVASLSQPSGSTERSPIDDNAPISSIYQELRLLNEIHTSYSRTIQDYNRNMGRYNDIIYYFLENIASTRNNIQTESRRAPNNTQRYPASSEYETPIQPQQEQPALNSPYLFDISLSFVTPIANRPRNNATANVRNSRVLSSEADYIYPVPESQERNQRRRLTNMGMPYLLYPLRQALSGSTQEEPAILSAEEIGDATSTFVYSRTSDMSDNPICPISLEEFAENETLIKITHCGHTFKRESLMRWLDRNDKCPVCRYDLRTSTTSARPIFASGEPADNNSRYTTPPITRQADAPPNAPRRPATRRSRDSSAFEFDITDQDTAQLSTDLTDIISRMIAPFENLESATDVSGNYVYTFQLPPF